MSKFKDFVKKMKISERIFSVCALIILVFALLPLFRLGLYASPFYDDYGYGSVVKHTVVAGGGLAEIIQAVIYNVKTTWYSWQGTYGSIIFMSVMPAVFGEQYYFIGSWVMIGALSVSVFCFSGTVARKYAGADRIQTAGVSSITVLLVVELIYTAHQGFYWYNGAVHYVFMYSLMLFMLTACINMIFSKNIALCVVHEVLLIFLSFLVAGANFVVALQGMLFLLTLGMISAIKKNKKGFLIIPAVLVYAYGMRLNLAAPGNAVRSAFYTGFSPVKSIYMSFWHAFLYIPEFTGLITVVVMLVLAPVLWNIVIKSNGKFRYPGIVSLYSFCLYATGFTPSLYGMGNPGLERTLNVVKFTMQLLLVINEAYWLGWIASKRAKKGVINEKTEHNVLYYFACAIIVLLIFKTSGNQAGSFSSYGAYYYVHTGEAANYRTEYLYTIDAINESAGGDVVVSPHVFRPWLLCGNYELSDNPAFEENVMMANYYDINSIRIETQK